MRKIALIGILAYTFLLMSCTTEKTDSKFPKLYIKFFSEVVADGEAKNNVKILMSLDRLTKVFNYQTEKGSTLKEITEQRITEGLSFNFIVNGDEALSDNLKEGEKRVNDWLKEVARSKHVRLYYLAEAFNADIILFDDRSGMFTKQSTKVKKEPPYTCIESRENPLAIKMMQNVFKSILSEAQEYREI